MRNDIPAQAAVAKAFGAAIHRRLRYLLEVVCQGLDVVIHRQLFYVAEPREVALPVEVTEFLDGRGLKDFRLRSIQDLHHLFKRFGEFAGWIRGRVLSIRHEVINPHLVVLIRIDESQVNRDRVGRAPSLAEFVANNQEVSEPLHALVLEGRMEIREWLKQYVFSIFLALKAIPK